MRACSSLAARRVSPAATADVDAAAASNNVDPSSCRCRPGMACFDGVPFDELNRSVGGRLIPVRDEMAACQATLTSDACQADLKQTDDEFFYTNQVGGFMHSGYTADWNISHKLSKFAVAAETEADIQAGVAFAAKHNLRLAVKGTGHDWYGRSGSHPGFEGSLLIWTHKRKQLDWHDDGFVAEGCAPNSSAAAQPEAKGQVFGPACPGEQTRSQCPASIQFFSLESRLPWPGRF